MKISRVEFYQAGVCRVCKLQQRTRGWGKRSSPR